MFLPIYYRNIAYCQKKKIVFEYTSKNHIIFTADCILMKIGNNY